MARSKSPTVSRTLATVSKVRSDMVKAILVTASNKPLMASSRWVTAYSRRTWEEAMVVSRPTASNKLFKSQ